MYGARYLIEIEPDIREWLSALPARLYAKAEEAVDVLAERPTTLGEPYSRHLGGPVRELRFGLAGAATRVTYWLAPEQRIVLLTVFSKTRMRETAEVTRALWAQKICQAEHLPAHEEFGRAVTKGDIR
ncbi:type II toxin-antitoxin system RelE/ParE family toxin [Kitasatospora sp. NPDC059795]|uniref:type II toxin-antitoxin system RelE/ParE family toxin n=1 Tax=Kitasatospora sp. NPDC059795 TaxID=3346949 RepID=UPI003652B811